MTISKDGGEPEFIPLKTEVLPHLVRTAKNLPTTIFFANSEHGRDTEEGWPTT